jgi:hypothetical protein
VYGEWNAIRWRGFSESELTFVGIRKAIPVLPPNLFMDCDGRVGTVDQLSEAIPNPIRLDSPPRLESPRTTR